MIDFESTGTPPRLTLMFKTCSPAVLSVPIVPVPPEIFTPYVVPAVSAPTFDIVMVSTVPVLPCVQVAASVPLVGSAASIDQFEAGRSTAEPAIPETVNAPAVLHHFVSSASGNSIFIVDPDATGVDVSIASIISTACVPVPFKLIFNLLRKTYTADSVPACVVVTIKKDNINTNNVVGTTYFSKLIIFFTMAV